MVAVFDPIWYSSFSFARIGQGCTLGRNRGKVPSEMSSMLKWYLPVLRRRSCHLQCSSGRPETILASSSARRWSVEKNSKMFGIARRLTVELPRVFSHTDGENAARSSSNARAWKAFSIQLLRLVLKNMYSFIDLLCSPSLSSHPIRGIPREPSILLIRIYSYQQG